MVFEKFGLGHRPATEEISLLRANADGNHLDDSFEETDHDEFGLPAQRSCPRSRRRIGLASPGRLKTRLCGLALILLILLIIAAANLRPKFRSFLARSSPDATASGLTLDWDVSSPRLRPTLMNAFGLKSPRLGSSQWKDLYPPSRPSGPAPHPSWVRRYSHLRSLGSLNGSASPLSATFTVPQATLSLANGLAQYPPGTLLGAEPGGICSYRRTGCLRGLKEDAGMGLQDVWFGLPQTWSVNFDDGPLPPSASLYTYLSAQNQSATHFWIGSNVRDYPELALQALARHDHLAVHTWSHAHLTTLDDLGILGELGWTMQIIYDLCGLVPLYYRPPYGDVDNRVRALAKHVFGLKTLMWNADSSDWTLDQTHAIGDFVDPPMAGFGVDQAVAQINNRARQPAAEASLGVIILEHELSELSVKAFQLSFETVKASGYRTCTVPECLESDWYQFSLS